MLLCKNNNKDKTKKHGENKLPQRIEPKPFGENGF